MKKKIKVLTVGASLLVAVLLLFILANISRESEKSLQKPVQGPFLRIIEKHYVGDGKWHEKTLREYTENTLDALYDPSDFPTYLAGTLPIRNITIPEGYINCGKDYPDNPWIIKPEESIAVRTCFVNSFREGKPAFMEIFGSDEEGWLGMIRVFAHNQTTIEVLKDSEDFRYDTWEPVILYYVYFEATCESIKATPKIYGTEGTPMLHLTLESCQGPQERIWLG